MARRKLLTALLLVAGARTRSARAAAAAATLDAAASAAPLPHDPLSLAPAACPLPAAAGGLALAHAAVHDFFADGRLEEALACCELALRGADLAPDAREAVAGNAAALRASLAPWRPGAARLFHNFEGAAAGFPPSDAPLGAARGMDADPAIQVLDGALTPAQCAAAIALFESAELFEGNVISAGRAIVQPESKLTWEFDLSGVDNTTARGDEWRALERLMVGVTVKALLRYEAANPVVRGLRNPLSEEGFRMRRYRAGTGEHHAYHVDGGQEARGTPARVLAAIIYFDAPLAGGETVFLNHARAVAPRCGRVLMFPSAFPYVHAGRKVTRGTKYVVTSMITL